MASTAASGGREGAASLAEVRRWAAVADAAPCDLGLRRCGLVGRREWPGATEGWLPESGVAAGSAGGEWRECQPAQAVGA